MTCSIEKGVQKKSMSFWYAKKNVVKTKKEKWTVYYQSNQKHKTRAEFNKKSTGFTNLKSHKNWRPQEKFWLNVLEDNHTPSPNWYAYLTQFQSSCECNILMTKSF